MVSENLKCTFQAPGLQKGGVPATPSGTATLLRLSPSYQSYLKHASVFGYS